MKNYNPKDLERKVQQKWTKENIYKTPEVKQGDKKYYSLYSFPYPSGSGLHVGHAEGMVANDIMARYYRMKGYKVLFPMGWDGFGLPAENFAIKTGTPPEESTENAVANFKNQIDMLGIGVDWSKELGTHRPDYYKWTQWIFLELFKRKKAYRKNAPVNWCPSCQTVLANEQVVDGKCERCDTEVLQKEMEQWFFKITDYSDRLDKDLDKLDWPNGTKQQQRNWIGKSEGTKVKFFVREVDPNIDLAESIYADTELLEKLVHNKKIDDYDIRHLEDQEIDFDSNLFFEIFTTRIDTIFGATFCVLAPEHKILNELKSKVLNWTEVEEYVNDAKNKTDLERQTQKEKTGVLLKGIRAINPFNLELIPIFVAEYVLGGYGTGAIMAVPAHDERDYEFAKKYRIPIREVIAKEFGESRESLQQVDDVSAVIFNRDNGKYLLLRSSTGLETLIGVIRGEGESYIDSLKREIREKAGIMNILESHMVVSQFFSNYLQKENLIPTRSKGAFFLILVDESCFNEKVVKKESNESFQFEWVDANEMYQSIKNIEESEHLLYCIRRAVSKNIELGNDKVSDPDKFKFDIITEYGTLFDSSEYSNLSSQEASAKMQDWLEEKGLGAKQTIYRLRDWLVSRQRYWGAPIPIIFSPKAKEEDYGYIPKESLNILVLHGFGSIGRKGWRIDLETEMTKLGHRVYLPDLPNTNAPDFDEWMSYIESNYSDLLKNGQKLVVIGHSLGGLMAFKLAEKYKLAKVVAIAPAAPIEDKSVDISAYLPDQIKAIKNFFEASKNLKFQSIKNNVAEIVVLNSKTDQTVRQLSQKFWKDNLSNLAYFVDFEDMGHFSNRDLPNGFPELFAFINTKGNSDMPGVFPVFERDLPVLLPTDVDFRPSGESPIKLSKIFNDGVKCPIYGTKAYREADTMDTFVDSSWYFLRYTDVNDDKSAFVMQKLLPPVYCEDNDITWNIGKEVAKLFQNFDYGFIGSFGISVLNGVPFKLISDVDLVISSNNLETALEILKKNNFKLIKIQQNKLSRIPNEKCYLLMKDNIKIQLFNFNWKESPNFVEKYVDGTLFKVEPIQNLIEYAKRKGYIDVIEMLESFVNQTNLWLPADIYMIGAEHTVLHLLYSRFLTKFFNDCGYINFSEPFPKMRHMGLILGSDSRKMSKRWGNVINPIDEIEKYSADTLRMYEMFMGPYEEPKPWNDRAENGVYRFLSRVSELAEKVVEGIDIESQKVEINDLIQKISKDIENLSYNTAVAKFMEFSNFLQKEEKIDRTVWETFLKLMAPFAPFLTDHLWALLGNSKSIHIQGWPKHDPNLIKKTALKIAVQVNGKVRGTLVLENELSEDEMINLAKENELIRKHITGEIKKSVYVKGKLLSLVV